MHIPASVPLSACRSCGAPIWWALTPAGKRAPFDVVAGQPTDQSHFATCPHHAQWRRRPPARKETAL